MWSWQWTWMRETSPFKLLFVLLRSRVDLRATETVFTRHPCVQASVWLQLPFEPHFILGSFTNRCRPLAGNSWRRVAGVTLRQLDAFDYRWTSLLTVCSQSDCQNSIDVFRYRRFIVKQTNLFLNSTVFDVDFSNEWTRLWRIIGTDYFKADKSAEFFVHSVVLMTSAAFTTCSFMLQVHGGRVD